MPLWLKHRGTLGAYEALREPHPIRREALKTPLTPAQLWLSQQEYEFLYSLLKCKQTGREVN